MQLNLPLTDPVQIVAIAMTVFLVVPLLFERVHVPGIVGILLAGAVLGPNGLHVLDRDVTIVLLGTVGLLYLVFLAALELDLHRFQQYRARSLLFGALSFGIPAVLGAAVFPVFGFGMAASVLLGSIIGTHTLLAYPTVSRLGLAKNLAVITVVGGTLVTDTVALAILAVVSGSMEGGLSVRFLLGLLGGLVVYVALVGLGMPRVGRWFFRNVPAQGAAEFLFLMVMLFGSAYLASLAGAQPIIGAFLAGLALNHLIPLNSPLMNRTRFIGNSLFIPFFLLSVGMLMDFGVLIGDASVWTIAGALTVLLAIGKWAAASLTRRAFRYDPAEAMLMFGLSLPQAAATLAVTFVGLEIGLFSETVVNAVIVMILLTCIIGPLLVERAGRTVAIQEDRKPPLPGEAPQRILIPMANPATADALLDLAFILRDPGSTEPVFPLMVVPDDVSADEEVAEAEKMLGHAVLYGAGAEVPVTPITRVDRNIASGIVRGVTETRSSMVVVGWDGQRAARSKIFGGVLDQVLARSKQSVVVAKLGHPLNTTARLLLIVPPRTERHAGFTASASTVKRLASQLNASILVLSFDVDPIDYVELITALQPDAPVSGVRVHGWGALVDTLESTVHVDDLVIVMGARRGSLPWHPTLERLPGILAGLVPESFLMIYPAEADTSPWESDGSRFPAALSPHRIVPDLPPIDYRDALGRLLLREFRGGARIDEIVGQLAANEQEFSSEVRPGVVLPHALIEGIDEPVLFLGVAPSGIEFPRAKESARLIFLLLSPIGQPQAHLAALAEIARVVSRTEELDDLLEEAVVAAGEPT